MTRDVWAARFDARYGDGAFARLCFRLEQAGRTFSSIAAQFGVTRERVRQWHRFLMPDAPGGRERRQQYRRQQGWQDLLHDDLFQAFYRHARRHVPAEWIRPVRTTHGYSRVCVRVNRCDVALRRARARRSRRGSVDVFRVARPARRAHFVYVWLSDEAFLLVPAPALPPNGMAFVDDDRSPLARFRNTFGALQAVVDRAAASVVLD